MKPSSRQHQRGAVLLLSVLIMASLTAIAGGIAAFIMTDLRSNQNIDFGIQAYYQAESGLESGLNVVKKKRNTGVCSNDATKSCQVDTDCPTSPPGICQYSNFSQTLVDAAVIPSGITSRVIATGVSRQVIPDLPKDQSVQFNIYNPDVFSTDTGIKSISFTGKATGATTDAWLEVTWSGWDSNGTFFDQTTKELISGCGFQPVVSCGTNTAKLINLQATASPTELIAFQVRVKAILGDVSNITVDAYGGSDGVTKIPLPASHIAIKSTSAVGQSQTALSAVVPWRLPASGLFDFVLFSEETIKKDSQ